MVVISLSDCPLHLRGDLTKWLFEISPGVFVGQLSARVREKLWKRIQEASKDGKAIMVFNTNNEQRLDFCIHNSVWEPIDFDGLKLILRPSPSRIKSLGKLRLGYSNASVLQKLKSLETKKNNKTHEEQMSPKQIQYPDTYIVIDVETTGLSIENNKIIELSALKIEKHVLVREYHALVHSVDEVPTIITKLTGITGDMLIKDGIEPLIAISNLIDFIEELPLVSHNVRFDKDFLQKACKDLELPIISNRSVDSLALSKKLIKGVENYKLSTLALSVGVKIGDAHRAYGDCMMTYQLYEKLINLLEG
jgi:CRISPR-associated protein Cas2